MHKIFKINSGYRHYFFFFDFCWETMKGKDNKKQKEIIY